MKFKDVVFLLIFVGALLIGATIYTSMSHGMIDAVAVAAQEQVPMGMCPKTRVVGKLHDCDDCHVAPDWRIKETKKDAHLDYPVRGMYFEYSGNTPVKAHYTLKSISAGEVDELFRYSHKHGVNHIVIEVYSPGGSVFGGARIVGIMRYWEAKGVIVETRVYGMALSAGLVIFASGTVGHRFVSPQAELMWHEIMSFKMYDLETPSSTEESMRVLRHLQDTGNAWLAERSNMTKEELDKIISNKEFWMSGVDAVKYGFADGFLK
jgi:ATP-dependent protease ClpP protease subunit